MKYLPQIIPGVLKIVPELHIDERGVFRRSFCQKELAQNGINFEGPAPRPLERLKIALAPDGQIIVDKSKKFLGEKGQWNDPGAKLLV